MTPSGAAAGRTAGAPRIGRATSASFALVLAGFVALSAVKAGLAVGAGPGRPDIVDFHPFWLAGRMALEGHFADSYRVPLMRAAEKVLGGRDVWTPFVYPPPFGLLMAPLALLAVGPAFLLFTAGTLLFYLAVLRRLAGDWFRPLALALGPVLVLNVGIGQNGLLAGGLAGFSAAAALSRRPGTAGILAGTLAFKPQTAVMLPVLFLLRRDGAALAAAAVAAVVLTAAAVLVLGSGTVQGFLAAASSIAGLTATDAFPLHRMASVYAFALGLGVTPRAALALHAAVGLAVLAASAREAARLGREEAEPRAAAGLILSATAFASPYLFDYDLAVYGAGLALLLPALARRAGRRLPLLVLALAASGGVSGLLGEVAAEVSGVRLAVAAPLLLACTAVVLGALRRGGGPAAATAVAGSVRRPQPQSL